MDTGENLFARALQKFRRTEGEWVWASEAKLTKREQEAFHARLRTISYIEYRRSPESRRYRYRVVDRKALERVCKKYMPYAPEELSGEFSPSARNIALQRSSKAGGRQSEACLLRVKRATAKAVWRRANGRKARGMARTEPGVDWTLEITGPERPALHFDGCLWLVENKAVYVDTSWIPDDGRQHAVAYYRGTLDNHLLGWLKSGHTQGRPRAKELYLFPDYDGVGLSNYARIKERLGAGVQFFLIDDWKDRLEQYGNNETWRRERNHNDFWKAWGKLKELEPYGSEVLQLMRTMRSTGLGLEQEAVTVPLR